MKNDTGGLIKMTMLKKLALSFGGILALASFASAGGYDNGTIVKVAGDSALYYMINGYAAHVPSPAVFQCLALADHPVKIIGRDQLNAMAKASFLIEGGNGKIYRVDGDRKRWVPNLNVFKRLGFNDAQVIHMTPDMVNCIPEVTPLH